MTFALYLGRYYFTVSRGGFGWADSPVLTFGASLEFWPKRHDPVFFGNLVPRLEEDVDVIGKDGFGV